MASAPGIALAATAVSFSNEWYDTHDPNFRILMAGGLFALFMAGLQDVAPQPAKGLATIMFITILFTPINGSSPIGTLAKLPIAQPKKRS